MSVKVKPTPSCYGFGNDETSYRTIKCVADHCTKCPVYHWTTLWIGGVPFVSIRSDDVRSAAYARLVDNHQLWIFTALANGWTPPKGQPNA